jgi:cytoskeleton protein RodZ
MDDFGGKLRQARERRGISLRQIAASTKIAAAALEALERNDISKLPGGIFSRAFVRSYAVEVGLDPDETVREFLDRFNQDPPPSAEVVAAIPDEEKAFEQRQRKAGVVLGILVATIPVIILVLYFALRSRPAPPPAPEPAQTAAAPVETPPAAPVETPPAPLAPAANAAAPSAASLTGRLTLDLHPTSACWVSLTVDGRKLFARVMQPGEHESHIVQREAVIDVGDAGAFAFSVNGRLGKSLGDRGQVKTLRLTPATAAQFTR